MTTQEELEKALSTLQQSVNGGYIRGLGRAKVQLSSGFTVHVQIIRRQQGFSSVWWGLDAPDGKSLLGGQTKGDLRAHAKVKMEAAQASA